MKQSPKWLERARETYKFHRAKILVNDDWTLTDTAKILRRSLGGVCEDIKIARALKIYEKEIEKFDYIYECLEFIRKMEKENEVEKID